MWGGDVFRITIPLTEVAKATVEPEVIAPNDDAINAINDAINLSINERKLIQYLKETPCHQDSDVTSLEMGVATIDRTIKKIKQLGLLERLE